MARYLHLTILLLTATRLTAQEPAKALEPTGAVPSTYRAFLVTDDRYETYIVKEYAESVSAGKTTAKVALNFDPRNRIRKMHDLVTDNGLNPVLAAFTTTAPVEDATKNAGLEKLALELHYLHDEFKAYRLGTFLLFPVLEKPFPFEDNTGLAADFKEKAVKSFHNYLVGKLEADEPEFGSKKFLDRLPSDKKERVQKILKLVEVCKRAGQNEEADKLQATLPPLLGMPMGFVEKKSPAADAWGLSGFEGTTIVYYDRMTVGKVWRIPGDQGPTPEQRKEIYDYVVSQLEPKRK